MVVVELLIALICGFVIVFLPSMTLDSIAVLTILELSRRRVKVNVRWMVYLFRNLMQHPHNTIVFNITHAIAKIFVYSTRCLVT